MMSSVMMSKKCVPSTRSPSAPLTRSSTAQHYGRQRTWTFNPAGPPYLFHDRDVLVTAYGRICIYREKINLSIVLAGQHVGIEEIDDGIWIVSFMRYDLGYIDVEARTLQPLDNPFGPK